MKKIQLCEPYIKGNEKKYLNSCIDTNWLSGSGKFVNQFEDKIKKFTSSKYAVANVNGTSSLHLALKVIGCKKNDEVIVPTLTFIAPVNAILYNNCSPIFMDSDNSFNLDINKVIKFIKEKTKISGGFSVNKKTNKKIKAIIIVHLWGNAVKFNKLLSICKSRNIKIIEDASESIGTRIKISKNNFKHVGTLGDIGCFSFNTNKIITCGSGGAAVTNNKKYYEKLKYYSTQAKDDALFYIHNNIGYNYRLNNLNAAVGCAQFELFDKIFKKKQKIYNYYKNKIEDINSLSLLNPSPFSTSNYWMNILLISPNYKLNRNQLIENFHKNNIFVRPVWQLNHLQNHLIKFQKYQIKLSHELLNHSLCLPSSAGLSLSDLDRIVKLL